MSEGKKETGVATASFESWLTKFRQPVIECFPKLGGASIVDADQFLRVVRAEMRSREKLRRADQQSVCAAFLRAARDGLLPDRQEAALVEYEDRSGRITITYMPMVKGVIKKIYRTGFVNKVTANVVYENDGFEYELGDNERITHRPTLYANRGKMIAAYAIANLVNGSTVRVVMTAEDIELVRQSSKSSNVWTSHAAEMWKKTAIHRISKILPSSAPGMNQIEYANAVADDDIIEVPVSTGQEPEKTEQRDSVTSALHEMVGG